MICHNLGHSNVHPWSRIVFVSLFLSFFILQLNKTGCMGLWRWGNFPTTTWPVVVYKTKRATAGFTFGSQVPSYYYSVNEIIMTAQTQPIITSWAKQRVKPKLYFALSHTPPEEKCGMDFPHWVAKPRVGKKNSPWVTSGLSRVTNRKIYHATFLLSGGVP